MAFGHVPFYIGREVATPDEANTILDIV